MRLLSNVLIICLCISSCKGGHPETSHVSVDDCNSLGNFKTYDEAISKVKSTDFKISESVATDKSSWIRGASYYSCDGQTGYLIIETDNRSYIHSGVPVSVWKEFKDAESFGSHYDHNIKGRYRLNL